MTKKGRSVLELVATVLVLCASLVTIITKVGWKGGPVEAGGDSDSMVDTIAPISVGVGSSPTIGADSSPAGIVMFTDIECPFCAKFIRETLPELRALYVDSGAVQFVLKHFPLEGIHPQARRAAQLAACATKQGRFWQLYEFLGEPDSLKAVDDEAVAAGAAMSRAELARCFDSDGRATVDADLALGQELGVRSTPTFFLGRREKGIVRATRRIAGAGSISVFRKGLSGFLDASR